MTKAKNKQHLDFDLSFLDEEDETEDIMKYSPDQKGNTETYSGSDFFIIFWLLLIFIVLRLISIWTP